MKEELVLNEVISTDLNLCLTSFKEEIRAQKCSKMQDVCTHKEEAKLQAGEGGPREGLGPTPVGPRARSTPGSRASCLPDYDRGNFHCGSLHPTLQNATCSPSRPQENNIALSVPQGEVHVATSNPRTGNKKYDPS